MNSKLLLFTLSLLLMSFPVFPHHSATAIFDMSKMIMMEGTLTDVDWKNPHSRFTVEPADKTTFGELWVFEGQPPQVYRRVGISRNKFKEAIGKTITIWGPRARNGEPYGLLGRIVFPDGDSFQLKHIDGYDE
jgi:hypothetical protein